MNAIIEDPVLVPRGLLGAARYAILHGASAPNTYTKLGEYLYPTGNPADLDLQLAADEVARATEADRDIKSANLQLLVEKVLEWETSDSVFQVAQEVAPQFNELFALARSLKQ